MKQLKTLIKYHQTQLDEKRLALKDLLDQADEIEQAITHLKAELVTQQALVTGDASMGFHYGTYAEGNKKKQEALGQKLVDMQPEIDAAEEEVREAYRELKKYEVTLERKEREAQAEADHREQSFIDEVASQKWHRKESSDEG